MLSLLPFTFKDFAKVTFVPKSAKAQEVGAQSHQKMMFGPPPKVKQFASFADTVPWSCLQRFTKYIHDMVFCLNMFRALFR